MKLRFLGSFVLFAVAASAASSASWETNGFSDFLKGQLSGLSVSAAGTVQPGPSVASSVQLGQSAAWAMTRTPDGTVYVATGNSGKVFKLGSNGASALVWTAPQAEAFAICTDSKRRVYVGTSPNGGVYRLERNGAELIWKSTAKYIWNLAAGSDGSLYAATGEPGQIYRIGADGHVSLYFDTGQVNVTALAISGSRVLAGTDPNGILYDISGPSKGSVLYDSSLPEIRSIALASDGSMYVAAMGGGISSRTTLTPASATAAGTTTAVPTTSTTITVTEAADQPSAVTPPQQTAGASSTSSSSTTAAAAQVVETPGVEKSAIYLIKPSGSVETVRTSKEDNVYDVLLEGNVVLFSTDNHGRIYRLANNETTLVAELADGPGTRMLQSGAHLYAAMSNPARVFELGTPGAKSASYESVVHDCTSVARWGQLQSRTSAPGIVFRVRTGNSARPDSTWSNWTDMSGAPLGRFIQWRAEWPAGNNSKLYSVTVPYLAQNSPPAVHTISVAPVQSAAANTKPATASSNSAYSITVTDTGESTATTASSSSQTVSGMQTTQTQISWQADDPDGDKLVYSVYFRSEDGTGWQLIRDRVYETTLTLDPDVFADGRYLFRVVASDSPSNAAEFAHQSELISSPVLIDNMPPTVQIGTPVRNGDALSLDVNAEDASSSLKLCEYSLDAGVWQILEAADGVTDSPKERFHLQLNHLSAGEHLLVFRVRDAANNAGLAKIVLR